MPVDVHVPSCLILFSKNKIKIVVIIYPGLGESDLKRLLVVSDLHG